MSKQEENTKLLKEILEQRIMVLDGAMGTMLQNQNLTDADFGGPALEGCNENLVLTRPDVVLGIHRKYLEAGSDIIETVDPIIENHRGVVVGEFFHTHKFEARLGGCARRQQKAGYDSYDSSIHYPQP